MAFTRLIARTPHFFSIISKYKARKALEVSAVFSEILPSRKFNYAKFKNKMQKLFY